MPKDWYPPLQVRAIWVASTWARATGSKVSAPTEPTANGVDAPAGEATRAIRAKGAAASQGSERRMARDTVGGTS